MWKFSRKIHKATFSRKKFISLCEHFQETYVNIFKKHLIGSQGKICWKNMISSQGYVNIFKKHMWTFSKNMWTFSKNMWTFDKFTRPCEHFLEKFDRFTRLPFQDKKMIISQGLPLTIFSQNARHFRVGLSTWVKGYEWDNESDSDNDTEH